MSGSKTRKQLVDVARQLFAKNGIDDTTMNDIAVASKKGRRTLYTYFKNKEDMYFAVIESELDLLIEMMRKVAAKDTPPDEKILELIYTHLDAIKEVAERFHSRLNAKGKTYCYCVLNFSATSGGWSVHVCDSIIMKQRFSRRCSLKGWRRACSMLTT